MVGVTLFGTLGYMSGRWQYKLKRTDIVLTICSSFLIGLLLARLHLHVPLWLATLLGMSLLIPTKQKVIRVVVAILFGVSLGVWRGAAFLQACVQRDWLADGIFGVCPGASRVGKSAGTVLFGGFDVYGRDVHDQGRCPAVCGAARDYVGNV